MTSNSRAIELRAQLKSVGGDVSGRHVRAPWSLPVFATFVTFAFVLTSIAPPFPTSSAFAVVAPGTPVSPEIISYASTENAQEIEFAEEHVSAGAARDAFTITEPPPPPPPPPVIASAPAVGVPDPGTAQAIAYEMLAARGWGDGEFSCLVALWNRESGWNVYANNASSGAYGIPQALPGSKMATAGADWATNPATQITWGLGYIQGRYGTPCGAWAASESQGWY